MRAGEFAREDAAEAPADDQDRLLGARSRRAALARRSMVSARGAEVPAACPTDAPASRPRPARARSSMVVRSLAMKPGMTSAGGPSSGPRGAEMAEAVRQRAASKPGASRQAPPAGRRAGRSLGPAQRYSPRPSADEAPCGSRTRPSAVWWFSSSGTRMRGRASAVLLSVWAKRTLPSLVAVAEVGAARLPVVQRRAAVRLAILAEARHPAFDVVHAILAEAHVAGRGLDHLVGDFERRSAAARPVPSSLACHSADCASSASQITYCSTFRNWWTRSRPRTSLPALPASRRKQGE